MVHLRINEREPNPNPYVNFITVLPMRNPEVEEAARQLLRALSAQVKPVMKAHGFAVNSLEEYEYNTVFAGRNWNHGETIELVLRSSTGSLLSTPWLMSTLCHELAHIKHSSHGPPFQALWRQLEHEVRVLQNKGYYGDGYWSSGVRLVDSAKIAGQGIEIGELPEYICGGAHSRARPVSRRPRRPGGQQVPKKRKAGLRVHSGAFNSVGKALNEGLQGEGKLLGVGFRKKAGSKRAREERALAAERRIQALRGEASSSRSPTQPAIEDDSDSEAEIRDAETDYDRHRTLLEVIEEDDLDALRAIDRAHDFLLPNGSSSGERGDTDPCRSITTAGSSASDPASQGFSDSWIKTSPNDASASTRPKKEGRMPQLKLAFTSHPVPIATKATRTKRDNQWDCMVCTLTNEQNHLACSACGTPRGELIWVGDPPVGLH